MGNRENGNIQPLRQSAIDVATNKGCVSGVNNGVSVSGSNVAVMGNNNGVVIQVNGNAELLDVISSQAETIRHLTDIIMKLTTKQVEKI